MARACGRDGSFSPDSSRDGGILVPEFRCELQPWEYEAGGSKHCPRLAPGFRTAPATNGIPVRHDSCAQAGLPISRSTSKRVPKVVTAGLRRRGRPANAGRGSEAGTTRHALSTTKCVILLRVTEARLQQASLPSERRPLICNP